MAEMVILDEVSPITGDGIEAAGCRICDFCCEGPWTPGAAPLKTMWQLPGGEVVCEACLPGLLGVRP